MTVTISIVIPCLNEQDGLSTLLERLSQELQTKYSFEVIIVDDGSTDNTLTTLKQLTSQYPNLRYISFSRNFGHQQALKAGIDKATGQCVIMMDADLQHPPVLIHSMVEKWKEGYDIVYTVRQTQASLPFFKKLSSKLFYAFINKLTDHPIDEGAADFRLVDRRVADIISSLYDPFLFLRGLIPWLGFRQCAIPYTPDERITGATKYSLVRMVRLALHGITCFSVRPLRLATFFGAVISVIAFLYASYAILIYFIFQIALPGWASIVSSILFLGGIQLSVLGIIGEYIGMLYMQSKHRPSYIVREQSKDLGDT